jgi:hypothetical protein
LDGSREVLNKWCRKRNTFHAKVLVQVEMATL